MEQITIAGEIFNAPVRYEEGHELTAGEASALNQTFHENLRNNFAKRVKDAKEASEKNGASFDLAGLQTEFDKYAEEYAFGVRTGGGAVRDPVMAEAMSIARQQIKVALKKKGINASTVTAQAITDAAKKLIAHEVHGPKIKGLAEQRVAEAQAAAADDLGDLVSSMPTKDAA